MAQVIIFGIGKTAEVVHGYLSGDSEHEVAAFTCDPEYRTSDSLLGCPVVPFDAIEEHFSPDAFSMFIAVGYHDLNRARAAKCAEAKAKGYALISYVSTRSFPGPGLRTGENCLVLDGVSVEPGAEIGDDVFLWSNVTVGHHSRVGDHVWLAAGTTVGGGTTLGSNCFVGLNATIGHEIALGERCFLGAGGLVTKDAAPGSVFIEKDTDLFRLDSERFLGLTKMK